MALENLKEGNLKKLLQKHSGCEQSSSEARERVDELVTEFLVKIAEAAGKSAYHKGSCDIVPQAPFFVKPGTFDKFSKGNRILPTG